MSSASSDPTASAPSSRWRQDHPYLFRVNGEEYRVDYLPAESDTGMFGGNSNWRGPVWFRSTCSSSGPCPVLPVLRRRLRHRVPDRIGPAHDAVRSSPRAGRSAVLHLPARRSTAAGRCMAGPPKFQTDPHWRDLILFHEYFHGDNGAGLAPATRPAGQGPWLT